jgi:phosphate acyltransferase
MGGDRAPGMVVRGACLARERHPDLSFILYGAEAQLAPLLDCHPELRDACTLRHAPDVVAADARPSSVLRQGRQSSLWLALEGVQSGEAAGVVSAGNTGALLAVAKFVLKTLPGISRPAFASIIPTMRGESVMLDLGANITCDARNLVEFAIMGDAFARAVLGRREPTVALLNVGAEELKGNEIVREAAALLRESALPIDFRGFVEGNDINAGKVDVVVTDGFTGNVALKAMEGAARFYSSLLRSALLSSRRSRLGALLARPALGSLRDRLDPRRHNGAIFLGLSGVVVKSHGGTDAFGFANAIGVAVDMITHGSNQRILDELRALGGAQVPPPRAAAS